MLIAIVHAEDALRVVLEGVWQRRAAVVLGS